MQPNEAKFYASLWENKGFVLEQLTQGLDTNTFIEKIDGWPPSAVKPLHGIMIFLFSVMIGLHDYTGQIFSALASLACIWLVFSIIAKNESIPISIKLLICFTV